MARWTEHRPRRPIDLGYDLHPVGLDAADLRGYYDGFANATLWPLYHDLIRQPVYHRQWWSDYVRVNRRFADAVADTAGPGDAVWVHDYHLQLVPSLVRERRPDLRIGFFLHVPFPPADLFARLPWRTEVLDGLAGADLIGFQTPRDADNFCEAEARLARPDRAAHLRPSFGSQRVAAYPVSIDYQHWNYVAQLPEVGERVVELRSQLGNPKAVLLGVDRLDYTKGIEHRLRAFRELLVEGRLTVPESVLVQVASPSRDRVTAYRNERTRIEQLVGEINGDFGRVGTPAVHYIHQPLEPVELAPLYRAADVMLVTPLHDGMNLVAKEFVASQVADRGVLVLSEFAGAAIRAHRRPPGEPARHRRSEASDPHRARRCRNVRSAGECVSSGVRSLTTPSTTGLDSSSTTSSLPSESCRSHLVTPKGTTTRGRRSSTTSSRCRSC